MKNLSEASSTALAGMQNTSPGQDRAAATSRPGSTDEDGTTNTKSGVYSPDEALFDLEQIRTILLSKIEPATPTQRTLNAGAVNGIIRWPTTKTAATYWLRRLLASFPNRKAENDGVFIADLTADLIAAKVPTVVLIATCDDIRQGTTEQNPWLPPSGEILKRAKNTAKFYHDQLQVYRRGNIEAHRRGGDWFQVIYDSSGQQIAEYGPGRHIPPMHIPPGCRAAMRKGVDETLRLSDKPIHNVVPWFGLQWSSFTQELYNQFVAHLDRLHPIKRNGYLLFCKNHIGLPADVYAKLRATVPGDS